MIGVLEYLGYDCPMKKRSYPDLSMVLLGIGVDVKLSKRYLDKLTRNLQNSHKDFHEVIVVHNCKEVIDEDTLRYVWETQVTAIYGSGSLQTTLVAPLDPPPNTIVEKAVGWFKTPFSRHVLLANSDSDLGENLNPWAFSLLRYWLKSVFVPVSREFSVVDAVVHYSNQKLQTHFSPESRYISKI